MVYYYAMIRHQNITDNEEEILSITSTKEEKKKIDSVILQSVTQGAILRAYVEREKVLELNIGHETIRNFIEIETDISLKEGETFRITMKNETSGNNAVIYGAVKYEIV